MPQRFDRLCRHGKDPLRRGAPLGCGLERCRLLGVALDALQADEDGDVLEGDALVYDTHDSYVHSASRLVTAISMGVMIVKTKDAVLVAPEVRIQDVKELVAKLKKSGRGESSPQNKTPELFKVKVW